MGKLDLSKYNSNTPDVRRSSKIDCGPPRHMRGEQFLCGPIPLDWLKRAARLPGKALQVSLAAWFRAFLKRTDTVLLTNKLVKGFGVSRHSKARALRALEAAGLMAVHRTPRENPTVKLLPYQHPRSTDESHTTDNGG